MSLKPHPGFQPALFEESGRHSPTDEWLTTEQAAELLQTTPEFLYVSALPRRSRSIKGRGTRGAGCLFERVTLLQALKLKRKARIPLSAACRVVRVLTEE